MVRRKLFSELNLLVLSAHLGMTLVNHSVMGISELSKHVPITPGIASMDVVLSQQTASLVQAPSFLHTILSKLD